jgi:hypothetical protein
VLSQVHRIALEPNRLQVLMPNDHRRISPYILVKGAFLAHTWLGGEEPNHILLFGVQGSNEYIEYC